VLSARDSENEKTALLDAGADDYVTKPFSPRELTARIGAVLRRANDNAGNSEVPRKDQLRAGEVVLDGARRVVLKNGEEVPVNPKEYAILELLMKARGAALSRDRILDVVWQGDFYGDARQLDVYIYRLREKLGDDLIQTARGFGYRIKA
jgi:DNA-binding response OmpR family regulator